MGHRARKDIWSYLVYISTSKPGDQGSDQGLSRVGPNSEAVGQKEGSK